MKTTALRLVLLFVLLLALLPCRLLSQKTGETEFLVNTTTPLDQREPVAARDALGNYTVVWTSLGQDGGAEGIYAQRYDALDRKSGPEFRVNTTTANTQYRPAMDMNASGRSVVVWASVTDIASGFDVFAQVFDASGAKLGAEFRVNTTTAQSQNYPDVAIDSVGNFCVVWHSWLQDGGDRGVYGQRFSASGAKLGAEFRVNTVTAMSQARPAIDMGSNGQFVVVWESRNQDSAVPAGYGLYGQRYAADATAAGGEFQINTYTNDYQWLGDVAMCTNGGFVVVWCSWRQDGSDGGIYGRRYGTSGEVMGAEFQVSTATSFYQWLPKVALFDDAGFIVTWSSWKQDRSREGVYAQAYDAYGKRRGLEFALNTYTDNYQWEPAVITAPDNTILAVWSSWNQITGGDYDVYARRVAPEPVEGYIKRGSIEHPAGTTTAFITVVVVDTMKTTGDRYRVAFAPPVKDTIVASITNVTKNQVRVSGFRIDQGPQGVYYTKSFDGVVVQFSPVYATSLDLSRSYASIHSASNVQFSIVEPTAGKKEIAPIDVVLTFGSMDTLNGTFVSPLDTALSRSGQRTVVVPFKARNRATGADLRTLVLEPTTAVNKMWDPGEPILFIAPAPYGTSSSSTHAQVTTLAPSGVPVIRPHKGDSVFIFTSRPVSADDVFEFTTEKKNFTTSAAVSQQLPSTFRLEQNYPNPFNPSTTIQ